MPSLEVPFVANPGGKCQQACTEMTIRYFEPDVEINATDINELTAYVKGKPTWDTASLIALHDRGYQIQLIEPFDHTRFIDEGDTYLSEYYGHLGEDVAEYQVSGTDIALEQKRLEELLTLPNVHVAQRQATSNDLTSLIADNWLGRLEVNGYLLAGQVGYAGHSVLAIGYSQGLTYVHNPDGKFGSKPNQRLDYPTLDAAWAMGHYAVHAVKK